MKIAIRYFMLLSLFHTATSALSTVHAQNVTSVSGMVKALRLVFVFRLNTIFILMLNYFFD